MKVFKRCHEVTFAVLILLLSGLQAHKLRHEENLNDSSGEPAEVKMEALLLVEKRILNKLLVQSMDVIVEYRLFNVGSETARDVHLTDDTFDNPKNFTIVAGLTDVNFGAIRAGANVSHVIVFKPLIPGVTNFEPAQVSYRPSLKDSEIVIGQSTASRRVIHPTAKFSRELTSHFQEWAVFVVLCLPTVLFPFVLWFKSESKYENLVNEFENSLRYKQL